MKKKGEEGYATYSSYKHRVGSGQIRRQKAMEKMKRVAGLDTVEDDLKEQSNGRKAPTLNELRNYLELSMAVSDRMADFYNRKKLRLFRLLSHGDKKKQEMKMLQELEQFCPSDNKRTLVIYGDWSSTYQLRGHAPTPGKRIRKLIASKYEVQLTNEAYTTCLI